MVTRDRDRGQLIVTGSVLIAVVIVGLAVIVNSVVFTANAPYGEATTELSETREISYEVRKATRSVLLRLNHRSKWTGPAGINSLSDAGLTSDANTNVTEHFGRAFARSYASTGPTSVGVDYASTDAMGTRVVQIEDEPFVSDDGSNPSLGGSGARRPNWAPVRSATRVGWFAVNLDASASRSAYLASDGNANVPFTVTVTDSTGDYRLTVSVTPKKVDGELAMVVRSELKNGPGASVESRRGECDPENGRVLLDLVAGDSAAGNCEFHGLADLDPPGPDDVVVAFADGDNLVGSYEFVTTGWGTTAPTSPSFRSGGTAAEYRKCLDEPGRLGNADRVGPCRTPAIWRASVGVSLQSSDVEFTDELTVEVYP